MWDKIPRRAQWPKCEYDEVGGYARQKLRRRKNEVYFQEVYFRVEVMVKSCMVEQFPVEGLVRDLKVCVKHKHTEIYITC